MEPGPPEVADLPNPSDAFEEVSQFLPTLPFTKLAEIQQNRTFVANSNYVCFANESSISILNANNELRILSLENKSLSVESMELAISAGKLLAVISDSEGFSILDLDEEKEIRDIGKTQRIENVKWHPFKELLVIHWEGENLEVLSWEAQSFESRIIEKQDIWTFDVSPSEDLEIAYLGNEGAIRVWKVDSGEESILGKVSTLEMGVVSFLDHNSVVLNSDSETRVYRRFPEYNPIVLDKNLVKYEPKSDSVIIGCKTSCNVYIGQRDSFLQARNEKALVEYGLQQPYSSIELRPKENGFDLITLHETELYAYSYDNESKYDESNKKTPKRSKKRKNIKQEKPKPQLQPKDICNPVQDTLNKRFEELQKRLDKNLSEAALQQWVSRAISTNIEQKSTENQAFLKSTLEAVTLKALKHEVTNTIIPELEHRFVDTFGRMYMNFQEVLRQSSERNSQEEIKSQSINHHFKTTIENLTNLSKKISKVAFKQMKRIAEMEFKLNEKMQYPQKQAEEIEPPQKNLATEGVKKSIESSLKNEDFQKAILDVLRTNNWNWVTKVLDVIDPEALLKGNYLNGECLSMLFEFLVEGVSAKKPFKDAQKWLEELSGQVPIPQADRHRVLLKLCDLVAQNPDFSKVPSIYSYRFS